MFWHPYFAEAIRAAADGGARVFGMGVTFPIPVDRWARDHDRLNSPNGLSSISQYGMVSM
jgi:hypothetical protein